MPPAPETTGWDPEPERRLRIPVYNKGKAWDRDGEPYGYGNAAYARRQAKANGKGKEDKK